MVRLSPSALLSIVLGSVLTANLASAQSSDAVTTAVHDAAERMLASRYPERADRMRVRVRRVGGTIDSIDSLRLDVPHRGRIPEGPMQVRVRTTTDAGRGSTTGWALLEVAHFDSVATVQRRIRPGASVTASDVEMAWMETTDLHGEPLRASAFRSMLDDGTLVATRLANRGRILRRSDVRPPYAADTGTSITMLYTRGRLAVRLTCKAREPGRPGDTIRVYCPGARTTYQARLDDDGRTARWIETL